MNLSEQESREQLLRRLEVIEARLAAVETHAATAAEVLAHAEQMLIEWHEMVPLLREIRLGERRGRGNL